MKISTDKEADARLRPYSIVRSSPNAILMFRSGQFDLRAFGTLKGHLDLYDREKLTYIRGQEVVDKLSNGAKLMVEDMVYFDGGPVMIARTNGERTTIYYQRLERNLTRLPAPYETLLSWPVEVKERNPGVVGAGNPIRTPFFVHVSRDSTHMLIRSPEIRDDNGEAFYLLAMVGQGMEVKWQHIVPVGEKAKRSKVLDVALDNEGNAYVVVKNNFSAKDVVEEEVNFEIKLFMVSDQGAAETKVELGRDIFPSSALLQPLQDDRIAFAGVYGNTADKRLKTLGNFIATFEAGTMQFADPVLLPFHGDGLDAEGEAEEEEVSKFVAKDMERMAASTDLIALLPKDDGGYYLVNELYYVVSYYDMNTKSNVTKYYHGPVQARNMDSKGEEAWSTTFRRWFVTQSPLLGRVFPAEFDNGLFLFLLDSEKMAERRKAGEKIKPGHADDPYSAYVSFDGTGSFKVKSILKNDKDEDFISGWELVRTGADEYIALGTEKLTSGKFLPVRIEFSTDSR
ncbi:MAG: hypothetical protein KDC00_08170 [Flavobacteriales bacterium]|nr:hypothetical protein [Flavobacteriales bacterium]